MQRSKIMILSWISLSTGVMWSLWGRRPCEIERVWFCRIYWNYKKLIRQRLHESQYFVAYFLVLRNNYPQLTHNSLKVLLPFSSTYLIESAFSALAIIKFKNRNKLSNVEVGLRCALTSTITFKTKERVASKQGQKSY